MFKFFLLLIHTLVFANPPLLDGVYKHRHKSATIAAGKQPGEVDTPYQAEDIIELVSQPKDALYFRIHIDFYNGHTCDLYGISHLEGEKFVYRETISPTVQCFLTIEKKGSDLFIDDGDTCRSYCGTRGSFHQYKIALSKRREIKYLKRILASRQYLEAIEKDKKQSAK